jgi:hypothetical protein
MPRGLGRHRNDDILVHEDGIASITRFHEFPLLARFGVPDRLGSLGAAAD